MTDGLPPTPPIDPLGGPGGLDWLLGPGFLADGAKDWAWLRAPVAQYAVPAGADGAAMAAGLAQVRAMANQVPKGGAVAGYLSYEIAGALEPSLTLPAAPSALPLAMIARFDAVHRIDPPPLAAPPLPAPSLQTGAGAASYEAAVARIISHIRAGDIFQANLSRRQSAHFPAPSSALFWPLFARLMVAAAPFAAALPFENGGVLSNSPELFLKIEGDRLWAEPIKGTRPRGRTLVEDEKLATDLAADAKERAENIMIADLLRNDVAKVCEDHSIEEQAICAVRTLPHVHHLYSRIAGRLRAGVTPFDALLAAFPCGSVTGAPKHEAMRVIAAQEGEGRGPYCGTIFFIPDDGPAVFSVPIRTGVLVDQPDGCRLDVRSGGGVTILSEPAQEYAETVDKAYAFRAMVT